MNLPLQPAELEQLAREGCFVRPDWLPAPLPEQARAAVEGLEGFRPAQIGRGPDRQQHPEIRGDELLWLDPADPPVALLPVVRAFEQLKEQLNREAYLGLQRLELQAARYSRPGAHYERHLDSFRGRPGRRLTCLYYLNPAWAPSQGGLLRLHLASGPVDIPPQLNQLVVFLSDEVEHQVLPSFAVRWALTAWWSGG